MRTMRLVGAAALALLLTFTTFVTGCGGSGGAAPPQTVYIYATDFDTAYDFKAVIEGLGGSCDLVPLADVSTADFSPYDVIIIGHDTSGGSGWDISGNVIPVDSANKPVLGIGTGGSDFFDELALDIGWLHTWGGSYGSIDVVDAALPVYTTPNDMSVVTDLTVSVYYAPLAGSVSAYVPTPGTVEVLCRETGDASHYLVARQERFMLWGFQGSASTLTGAGKDLFENVVAYIRNF